MQKSQGKFVQVAALCPWWLGQRLRSHQEPGTLPHHLWFSFLLYFIFLNLQTGFLCFSVHMAIIQPPGWYRLSAKHTHFTEVQETQQNLMGETVVKPGSGQHPPLIFWEQCRAHTPTSGLVYFYSSPNSCPPTKAEALMITDFLLILFMRKHHNPCSWIPSSTIPTRCSEPVFWLLSFVIHWEGFGLSFLASSLSLASTGPSMPEFP